VLRDGAEAGNKRVASRAARSSRSERHRRPQWRGAGDLGLAGDAAFVNPRCCSIAGRGAQDRHGAAPILKYLRKSARSSKATRPRLIKRGVSRAARPRQRLGIPVAGGTGRERKSTIRKAQAARTFRATPASNHTGIAGVERFFDQQLTRCETLQLAIDCACSAKMRPRRSWGRGKRSSRRLGATATSWTRPMGEIIAMASLPTYYPNRSRTLTNEALFTAPARR